MGILRVYFITCCMNVLIVLLILLFAMPPYTIADVHQSCCAVSVNYSSWYCALDAYLNFLPQFMIVVFSGERGIW